MNRLMKLLSIVSASQIAILGCSVFADEANEKESTVASAQEGTVGTPAVRNQIGDIIQPATSGTVTFKNGVIVLPKEDVRIESFKDEVVTKEDAIKVIFEFHEGLNTHLGWENHKKFKRDAKSYASAWHTILTYSSTYPEMYIHLATILPDKQSELSSLSDLATIARENMDYKALLYMHRVLHKLDEGEEMVTAAEVAEYITENIRGIQS